MKLTDTATHLNTVLNGLQTQLLPELKSAPAKANADYLLKILKELINREQNYPEVLPAIIAEGMAIIHELRQALSPVSQHLPQTPKIHGQNIRSFNAVSAALAELGAQLSKYHPDIDLRLTLLRRAADWESKAHNTLTGLHAEIDGEEAAAPLTQEALQDFIRAAHPDGDRVKLTCFDRIMGGFGKQTWAITVENSAGQSQSLIVRKCEKVPTCDHKMFDLNREFDLLRRLSELGFPAPKPLWMGNEAPGSDAPFYVMERLPGKPPGSYLESSGKLPEELVLQWAEIMATLHSYPLDALSGFTAQYERPSLPSETMSQCYRNNLNEWRNYAETTGHFTCPTLNYVFDWLEQNIPDDLSPPSLIHGDFGIHNMLTENGRVTGILDWEAATFGSPFIDLSYVKPKVEEQMEWEKFLRHYEKCGGPKLNPADMTFYQVYQLMFIMIPMNRTVDNIQTGLMKEPRFTMFELGFLPQFMRNILAATHY